MLNPTIPTKIFDFFQTTTIEVLEDLFAQLVKGDLRRVEQQLSNLCMNMHSRIMALLIPAAAETFSHTHQAPQGVKSTMRPHRIRIATGQQVEVSSPYYKVCCEDTGHSRRPLLDHWQTIDGYSPLLYDRVGNKERKRLLNQFLVQLKTGQTKSIVEKLKSMFRRPSNLVKRWIGVSASLCFLSYLANQPK